MKLLASNSVRTVLAACLPQFERAHGCSVEVSYDPARLLLARVKAGERADAGILTAEALAELAREGRIVESSRRTLARSLVGIAVRAGAPKPEIGSVEAFRRMLLEARAIAHTLEGASGIHFARLLEQLGIAAEVRPKCVTRAGGLTAELVVRGAAEIAVQQISELKAVAGVEVVGPLPPELQCVTVVEAAVFAGCAAPHEAQALLEFLAAPACARLMAERGLEPAGAR